ncbi:UDP-2,4-diacetamido-2,4,6-trideoxy-beta-L-altropyranose hydrolase [Aeromonas simiae]|uniref:UDP-2,4-diacetamido-2,4, 6-trideoxy-beta-L-altropyranose hydrolase n=1 Tax=Aeromonas simiae TaxID=218936 RepID=UPI00266B4B54|nr:UDP-2,4-diacetamido-2,4,6-trideoxy-beta-L-altropyranose hydrolase [Aeromonas simiae]MDO2947307.1 UDP-2,4-diacetamido-2,4,6-trideoxy-beta-L-altropyranose hydrolase [Aeromonas simiae]MDO2951153.1 UDP-2,4-diacetamido-2,4,6-trideoxy-beta-L-altropyranose hydrolase [Aeromonas simiae]MDO2954737.1 UDP-2,4-diacetamido-2,4,6-trideoxy-beta-L-altropyranose hydrolase [Aeromonas simiae]
MMLVAIRTDSSARLGLGHVMRCLTLATTLRERGITPLFLCRDEVGERSDLLRAQQMEVILLPSGLCDWQQDAEACLALLTDRHELAALIVDHYALDERWERQLLRLRPGMPLLAIDDLANRAHHATLLLDQTPGRHLSDYSPYLIPGCELLLGARYGLLRPAFSRPMAPRNVPSHRPWELLINLGGTDPDNITLAVLQALSTITPPPQGWHFQVVLGRSAPHLEQVQQWCTLHGALCHVDVEDMAALFDRVDLAIGAGGTTAWERCSRALPSILLQLADNQALVCHQLNECHAAIALPPEQWQQTLGPALDTLIFDTQTYHAMSRNALGLFDGHGRERVCEALLAQLRSPSRITLAPMDESDTRRLWLWQCAPKARLYCRNPASPAWEEHVRWFEHSLRDPKRRLLRIEQGGRPVGMLRLDTIDEKLTEISILVAATATGQGIASEAIGQCVALYPELTLLAEIHPSNHASIKAFSRHGFLLDQPRRYIRKATLPRHEPEDKSPSQH